MDNGDLTLARILIVDELLVLVDEALRSREAPNG